MADRDPAACAGGAGLLTGDRVGNLRLGMSVDSAMLLCPTAIDTFAFAEGERLHVLFALVGDDAVRMIVYGTTISSIVVTSPAFMTADSLGPGAPVGRLLTLARLEGGFGEGDFYVWSDAGPACGISFRLDDATAHGMVGIHSVTSETLRPYATSGRIIAALVRGCR